MNASDTIPTLFVPRLPSGTSTTLRALLDAASAEGATRSTIEEAVCEASDFLVNTLRDLGMRRLDLVSLSREVQLMRSEDITPDRAGFDAYLRVRRAGLGLGRATRQGRITMFVLAWTRGMLG